MQNQDIPIMILAGGRGTRLMEETREIPKPMVTIGGKPILLHLMQYYSRFGFRKFIVCLGYKGEIIKEYFLPVRERTSSVHLHAGGKVEYETGPAGEWDIVLAETGEHSLTATRIQRAEVASEIRDHAVCRGFVQHDAVLLRAILQKLVELGARQRVEADRAVKSGDRLIQRVGQRRLAGADEYERGGVRHGACDPG